MFKDEELSVFQIVECLVSNYGYQIVNVPEQKKNDVWLASRQPNAKYPMIRLNSVESNTATFEQDYLQKLRQVSMMLSGNDNILIINTNKKSEEFYEEGVRQLLFTNSNKNQELIDNFPLLLQYVKPCDDNDIEVAKIRKRLEIFQNQLRKKLMKARPKPKNSIKLIIMLVIASIANIGLKMLIMNTVDNYDAYLVLSGAQYKSFMFANGEWWRAITSFFVNTTIFQLLLFAVVIYIVGRTFEQLYKSKDYWILLLLCMLVPTLGGYILESNTPIYGASAFIMGLIGACISYFVGHGQMKTIGARMNMVYFVIFTIMVCTMPNTSFIECGMGFLVGYAYGFFSAKEDKYIKLKPHLIICSILLIVGMVYAAFKVNVFEPVDQVVNDQVVRSIKKDFKWDSYANSLKKRLNIIENME